MRGAICLKSLIVFLSMLSIIGSIYAADTPSAEELYVEGNRAYRENRYQQAIDGYLRLLDLGYRNGHVYYNLANAYLRAGQLGRAILNYERAMVLIPRDADLNFNLRYALDRTQDAVTPSQNFIRQAFFWLDELSLDELLWGFGVVNIIFWSILALRLFVRPEWSYYVLIVMLIFWLAAGASLGMKWHQLGTDRRSVILADEVEILAGPDKNDTVLFKLHEGTIVQRERVEAGWSLIRLSEDKRGWIKSDAIEQILINDN